MLRILIAAVCSASAIALAACGSNDPGYCDQLAQLVRQINDIRDTNVIAEGTNALRSRVEAALTQTQKLADAARTDFPDETRDLDAAVTSVKTSLDDLGSADTRAKALVSLPGQLQATVDAAEQLETAVADTCS